MPPGGRRSSQDEVPNAVATSQDIERPRTLDLARGIAAQIPDGIRSAGFLGRSIIRGPVDPQMPVNVRQKYL